MKKKILFGMVFFLLAVDFVLIEHFKQEEKSSVFNILCKDIPWGVRSLNCKDQIILEDGSVVQKVPDNILKSMGVIN